ncbi:hypothetical protein HPC49_06545 [Pyxidicoccus fallax]|uniref:EF-hand domain-containing protein n=1 Tax=Pyxidicoccus fallax TaxID=394095 RepID=A0A848LI50_9BACT|nr:hypothetical protein [Pyxidicoccus fallax]NMO17388.1 EF-hand domain-containing protein [Pyxidicoccus fallax]NPC77913.1 hypothetical protein [Pyxidicoccus fallax]
MTSSIGPGHSRTAQYFSRTSLDVSHSRTSVRAEGGAVSASRTDLRAAFQTDGFSGGAQGIRAGGCFPTPPQCGPEPMNWEAATQLFQQISQMLEACINLFKSQCEQPRTPPDCQGPTKPTCPTKPPPCPPEQKEGKMWDVFFDAKQGTQTKQKSPIVLDLNGNGQADITGSNIKGNGKLEGQTVKGFDLDPSNRQWTTKSVQRRPGKGAPELPKGTKVEVFDANGKKVKSLDASALNKSKAKSGDMGLGLSKGMRAEFRDANGKLVGELKTDAKKNQLMYHFGNVNENEWTKAWDSKTGGDGILAWDVDGDGKITSGKELFGHVDLNGKNSFDNGYEKLSKYFDKDGNGRVEGNELQGLKVWEDRNGDGVTQKGELVDATSRGINSLNTQFNYADMGSSYKHGG